MNHVVHADFDKDTVYEKFHEADTNNGYTRLTHSLYEHLNFVDLNRNELKVAHTIIRKTVGFNKKFDRISDSQIAEKTNLSRQAVNFAKNSLLRMRVLLREGPRIGLNKSLSEWDIRECHRKSDGVTETQTKLSECLGHKKASIKSISCHDPVRKTRTNIITETRTGVSWFPGHTKETITKDNKENIKISQKIRKNRVRKINPSMPYPPEFTPSEQHIALAQELGVNLTSEWATFGDYHTAKGTHFKNWEAALNTWLRNAVKFGAKPPSVSARTPEHFHEQDYGVSDTPAWMNA